jgi:hypothetical protein
MAAAGLFLLAGPALAQSAPALRLAQDQPAAEKAVPAAKLALAGELIDATGAMHSFDPVLPQILADARRTVLNTNPDVEKDLDASLGDVEKELQPRRKELHDQIARLYAGHFTSQELKELIQFYKSAVGEKLVKETPLILRATYSVVQDWARQLSFDVMNKLRAEMKKKGHDI